MNIGERIKKLRSAKMLTQAELAGDKITRNMLSRIENGAALPSLSTVTYLAARLGVPAGFLMAEDGDEFYYKKMNSMPNIKRAFVAGDFKICRDMCAELGGADDETLALSCLCSFNLAKEKFFEGKLGESTELFEDVILHCDDSIYPNDAMREKSAVYLSYMHEISPSVGSELGSDAIPPEALSDPFCRYYAALRALDGKNGGAAAALYLEGVGSEEHQYAAHIRARVAIDKHDHRAAYSELRELLTSELELSAPMMYFIFSDLEKCCSEMSDYRGAYEYSGDKIGLLEKFLR